MRNSKANKPIMALLGGFVLSLNVAGCAHSGHARGSIAIKHNEHEADVCLGNQEVKPGDRVTLFRNDCKPNKGGRGENGTFRCTKVKLGEGEVLHVLDEHYSTIRINEGVSFSEGVIVEKQ